MIRLEIDRNNLPIKFSALNIDLNSPSPDPLSWRRPAQAGVKDGYPIKVVILPLVARVAWRRLQIGTDMLLIITSNSDKLFIGVNVDDPEWPWTSKIVVLVLFSNLWLWRRFQEWIASKWIEIGLDQDSLRIGTARAVARLMSCAQITCSFKRWDLVATTLIIFHRINWPNWQIR